MASQVALHERFCSGRTIYAMQHIRRLRGGAQAQLMRASDGHFYVCKFSNCPQHVRVLANELLGARLGRLLRLPVPIAEIVEVSDWLIRNTADLRIESPGHSELCSSGLQVGSRFAGTLESGDVVDCLPESLFPRVLNKEDFARMLVLDKWAGNADGRQTVFTRPALRDAGWIVHFIDHGYFFNAGEWTFPDLALLGVYHRNHVYEGVTSWESFEPTLTLAEEMDLSDLWQCASGLPPEWCGDDPGELSQLVESMYQRRVKIRDLIRQFRVSSRNPFPNWRDD